MHECPGKSSVGTKENGFVCNMLGEPEIYRFPAMHAHGDVWEMSESVKVPCLQI